MNVISPKSKFVMKIFFKPIMTSALLSDDQKLPTLDSFWYMTSQICYGLFEHTRMGLDLCNTTATFQRAMNLVLCSLTWTEALVYKDDVMSLETTLSVMQIAIKTHSTECANTI